MWKGALVLLVSTCALVSLELGVEFSERPGTVDASWMLRFYDTIGLFVLGGLDLGEPVGGTVFGRMLMWFAYFGAPAITGLAVVETLLKTIAPGDWHFRKIRNHTIIVGSGNIGEIYLNRLRTLHPGASIIVVEPERDLADGSAVLSEGGPIYVHGDLQSDIFLDRLQLGKARRIVVATDDDFFNLDIATRVLARVPTLRENIIVHVADLSLLRAVDATRVARECTTFNTFHVAATHLVRTELLEWFQHTVEDDIVVLGGFGRFGQTVLDELQVHAGERFNKVVIIDPNIVALAAVFDEQVGFRRDHYEHFLISSDLASPETWKEIEKRFDLQNHTPAFVLGSSNDATNIRSALSVQKMYKETRAFARVSEHSSFAEDLAKDTGVRIISLAALLGESMPSKWFGR